MSTTRINGTAQFILFLAMRLNTTTDTSFDLLIVIVTLHFLSLKLENGLGKHIPDIPIKKHP